MQTTRVKLGAAAAFAALALPTTAAGQSGGQAAPSPDGGTQAGQVDPGFVISTRRSVFAGKAIRIRGAAAGLAGRSVRIERQLAGGWLAIGAAQADGSGAFSAVWMPEGPGRYVLRAVAGEAGTANASSARVSVPRTVTVYRRARASWYGPGFYGRRTACGQRLRTTTLGIAHRRLPCGTQVAVSYRGRSLVLPVIDRGPYARGVSWDLTGAAAEQLGVTVTSRIGVAALR
jgi:rare lipoprotein A